MNSEKTLLACIRKADFDYGLINRGDKILLGLSGGKDSMTLAKLLKVYQKFSDKDFGFIAAFIDLGFDSPDLKGLREFGEKEGIDLRVIQANEVASILRAHKNKNGLLPCSICSRMKKAIINKAAHEFGCDKVAFAHHADDAIETMLMNMTYGGRLATFQPQMHLTKENITFIRPFIYAREKDIIRYAREHMVPSFKNKCGNDGKTERKEFKSILTGFYDKYPPAYGNFLTMLTNQEKFSAFFDEMGYSFGDGVFLKKALTPAEMEQCFLIRKEVFIKEQKVSVDDELDGLDRKAMQFLIYENSKPVGTMRVFLNREKHETHFGRIAILKDYRGRDYGRRMVMQVEKILSRAITPLKIIIEAQEQALGFYEKLGFVKSSDKPFLDANIVHYMMEKEIIFPIQDKEKIR